VRQLEIQEQNGKGFLFLTRYLLICWFGSRSETVLIFELSLFERKKMNIYVGNLPWTMSEDELYDLFAPHGEVTRATIISDRDTGRSKGFGFVEMANKEEAETAIGALDGHSLNGRDIRVNEARPRPERQQRY